MTVHKRSALLRYRKINKVALNRILDDCSPDTLDEVISALQLTKTHRANTALGICGNVGIHVNDMRLGVGLVSRATGNVFPIWTSNPFCSEWKGEQLIARIQLIDELIEAITWYRSHVPFLSKIKLCWESYKLS